MHEQALNWLDFIFSSFVTSCHVNVMSFAIEAWRFFIPSLIRHLAVHFDSNNGWILWAITRNGTYCDTWWLRILHLPHDRISIDVSKWHFHNLDENFIGTRMLLPFISLSKSNNRKVIQFGQEAPNTNTKWISTVFSRRSCVQNQVHFITLSMYLREMCVPDGAYSRHCRHTRLRYVSHKKDWHWHMTLEFFYFFVLSRKTHPKTLTMSTNTMRMHSVRSKLWWVAPEDKNHITYY